MYLQMPYRYTIGQDAAISKDFEIWYSREAEQGNRSPVHSLCNVLFGRLRVMDQIARRPLELA